MAKFEFLPLTNKLYLVRWTGKPTYAEGLEYLNAVQECLDKATDKIYFISDLREGYIGNVEILQKLGRFTQHPNYGAGTSFGGDMLANVYVGVYKRLARGDDDSRAILDQAIKELEKACPGITAEVDWNAVL